MIRFKIVPTLLFILIFFTFTACESELIGKSKEIIKRSKLAGSWYPKNKGDLKRLLVDFLKEAKTPDFGKNSIFGIIAPHAGYVYSGSTAAYAFKPLIGSDIKTVIIFAPSHYSNYRGFSTPDYTHYETPLGLIKVDKKIVGEIRRNKLHVIDPNAHIQEHALEIELPYLQATVKDFKVVPVLLGGLSKTDIEALSKVFRKYLKKGTVFIISSDFTHYGPRFGYMPFNFKKGPTKKQISLAIKNLDSGAIDNIEALKCNEFRDYVKKTGATICGRVGITLFLKMLEGEKRFKSKLLKYTTSGELTGDYVNSVSYASIAFYNEGKLSKKGDRNKMSQEMYDLTKEEKKTLLEISRDTLQKYLKDKTYPDKEKYKITPSLEAKRGVFVTLHKKKALRGCIGYIEGIKPVYLAVMENSVNAALEDPRFPLVKSDELKDIDIEISVMTPLISFKGPDDIEVGKHGLVISKGWNRGLLLPQVATEWGWDKIEFLEAVSNKAGLPKNSWKDKDIKLEKFSAIVFGEK